MRMIKTVMAAAVAATLVSFGAHANQGGGTVTFTGNIVDAPCSINGNDANQVVEMGTISNSAIRNGSTQVKNFNIRLEGCDLQKYNTDGTPVTGGTWSGVKVTFTGATAGTNNQYLGVTDNVGIELTQGGKPLIIGTPADKVLLQGGNQTLSFGAQVKAVDATKAIPLKNFNTVANFAVAYE
ncbi:major pilin subunit PapA [Escherichia coli]|uniref:fimbrial protein n=1 Tax=Escherichia coli TaxID=562 RepID=UPI0019195D4B|nr:fimbrial protein [Escherichia coli]CAD5756915.1 major pilin subunit PapA [Escherichia coli]